MFHRNPNKDNFSGEIVHQKLTFKNKEEEKLAKSCAKGFLGEYPAKQYTLLFALAEYYLWKHNNIVTEKNNPNELKRAVSILHKLFARSNLLTAEIYYRVSMKLYYIHAGKYPNLKKCIEEEKGQAKQGEIKSAEEYLFLAGRNFLHEAKFHEEQYKIRKSKETKSKVDQSSTLFHYFLASFDYEALQLFFDPVVFDSKDKIKTFVMICFPFLSHQDPELRYVAKSLFADVAKNLPLDTKEYFDYLFTTKMLREYANSSRYFQMSQAINRKLPEDEKQIEVKLVRK